MARLRTCKGLAILVALAVVLTLFALPMAASAQNTWHVSKWTKYEGNPVLNPGSAGEWDDAHVHGSDVLYDGTTYHMWYTGRTGGTSRIGYATSPDGVPWTKYAGNPILNPGSAGEWDDTDVYCPAVVYDGTTYHMWYSGYNGTTSRIGYATSPDGVTWTKYDDPATTTQPYAESDPVLNPGSAGEWDDTLVYSPDVLYDGASYHMWYSGSDGTYERTGYATSTNGITWSKYVGNPVLNPGSAGEWDDVAAYEAAVLYDGATYHMWYTGCDGIGFKIGYATSPDGITWTKYDDPTTTVHPYAESDPALNPDPPVEWDYGSVDTPDVLYDGTTYHMWYAGYGDTSQWKIGHATNSYIDADFLSIQNAIDFAAPAGDTILVHPGKYTENLFINKSLTLQSVSGNWQDTIIDDIAIEPEITISGDADVTVRGFEITAGSYGIYIDEVFSTVNILDCFIHDNIFDGIRVVSNGTVLNIERNIISQNGLADSECGIHIYQAWNTTNIRDNIIGAWWDGEDLGTIYAGNNGDGIRIDNVPAESDVTIWRNLIAENGDEGIDFPSVASVHGSVSIAENAIGAWPCYYEGVGTHNFTGNRNRGIHVAQVGDTGSVTIEDNAISENGEDGINFGQGVSPIFGEVTILRNLIGAWTCYPGDYGYSGSPQRYQGNGDRGIEINQVGDSGASGTVTIEGNKISENHRGDIDETGIYIQNIYGVVTIEGNDIGSSTDRHGASYLGNNGVGIVIINVFSGAELTIGPDNSIKENMGDGIDILWGELDASIEIHHNTIDNNEWNGIQLGTPYEFDNFVISHDTVGNNGSNGIEQYLHCEVDGATINHNTLTNHLIGIYLAGPSDRNIISDNEIRDNMDGVVVEGNENQIVRNNILNNHSEERSGIHLVSFHGYPVSENIIHCNNIVGNLPYGVSYEIIYNNLHNGMYGQNSDEAVDATGNWWGCIEGPGAEGCDLISGNVIYDPWLPDEFQNCRECVGAPPPPGVPAVSRWGIAAMITLFAGLLVWTVRRRLSGFMNGN